MSAVARNVQRLVRKIAGENSAIERRLRGTYRQAALRSEAGDDSKTERAMRGVASSARFRLRGELTTRSATVFRRGKSDNRLGIYMLGACDLPTVFAAKPFIEEDLNGVCAIMRDGEVADARSDFLLQALDGVDPAAVAEAGQYLKLPPDAFEPRLFRPEFRIPALPSLGSFPKTVVVLSIAADLSRSLYRNNEHGYLVDPGGWWLTTPMGEVMEHLDRVAWMRENFTALGKIPVEEFHDNMGRIVTEVKQRTGAHVVVFNTLTVSPGDLTHTYQFVRIPQNLRRMEFDLALADIAAQHDVSVVDVDRVLKLEGVKEQIDFAHFPMDRMIPIAREFHRVLRDREII